MQAQSIFSGEILTDRIFDAPTSFTQFFEGLPIIAERVSQVWRLWETLMYIKVCRVFSAQFAKQICEGSSGRGTSCAEKNVVWKPVAREAEDASGHDPPALVIGRGCLASLMGESWNLEWKKLQTQSFGPDAADWIVRPSSLAGSEGSPALVVGRGSLQSERWKLTPGPAVELTNLYAPCC